MVAAMNGSHKYHIIPSKEIGWELWILSNGLWNLEEEILDDKLPKSKQGGMIYLPLRSIIHGLTHTYPADEKMEREFLMTQLEINESPSDACDLYKVYSRDDSSYYGSVILDEVDLDKSWIDCHFDVSGRAYQIDNGVLLLQEHGKWIYYLYIEGKLVFSDILGFQFDDAEFYSSLHLGKLYLNRSGLELGELKVFLIESDEGCVTGINYEKVNRADVLQPVTELMDLTPLEVKKWRKDRRLSGVRSMAALVACLLCLAVVVILFWDKNQIQSEIASLEAEIEKYQPLVDENTTHQEKWDELTELVDPNWSLEMYAEAIKHIPNGRLVKIDSVKLRPNYIRISGISKNYDAANRFGSDLRKSEYFREHGIVFPRKSPRTKSNRTAEFDFTGSIKEE